MLVAQSRPRNLKWYHAGPLLFGDWGTSRLYVLGLAFAATGFASPIYLLGLSVLMVGVAWAYTLICSSFHDGGGVYTAARQINPLLSVIGATLLIADYLVTAALSLVDAFHYFGVPEEVIFWCCLSALLVLGFVNWMGARNAGRFALIIALIALGFSFVIALASLPLVPEGIKAVDWGQAPAHERWTSFVSIILALSGVEAVANMTGIMQEPVPRTSRKTIWPVLAEVVLFNLLFSVSLVGLKSLGAAGFTDEQLKNSAMKVLAIESGQHWLGQTAGFWAGKAAAIAFGLLLLSAANTVIVGMIGILYSLGRDHELPRGLTRLNDSGVPWIPLVLACTVPGLILLITTDLEQLAHLYAIGVCGAITMNLLCSVLNPRISLSRFQRAGMWTIGLVMLAIWLTIAVTKPQATVFAGILIVVVLSARLVGRRFAAEPVYALPQTEIGWLAELRREPIKLDPSKPRIMLAARGIFHAQYAVELARRRNATLFAIFVRALRVLEVGEQAGPPRIESDPQAQESLGAIAVLARRSGVPFIPIYVSSPNIAEEILDYTVTYGCETLIMGTSRRTFFSRKIAGDVLAVITELLPEGISLVTRSTPKSAREPGVPQPAAEIPAAKP